MRKIQSPASTDKANFDKSDNWKSVLIIIIKCFSLLFFGLAIILAYVLEKEFVHHLKSIATALSIYIAGVGTPNIVKKIVTYIDSSEKN